MLDTRLEWSLNGTKNTNITYKTSLCQQHYLPQTPEFSTTRNFPGVVVPGIVVEALAKCGETRVVFGTPPITPSITGI